MQNKQNKKKRKRLLLALIAVLLSMAMVTGGTLMLFTWKSGTATNTVTTGNVHFTFGESADGGQTWQAVDDDSGLTLNFSSANDFYPGDSVAKRAQIMNDGDVSAYLKVEAKITYGAEDPLDAHYADSLAHQKIILDALFNYWDTAGSRIYGDGFIIDPASVVFGNGETTFTLYYASRVNQLTEFNAGDTAELLNADIHLPTYAYFNGTDVVFTDAPWGGDVVASGYYEISDYLFDVTFGLEYTAFAVQARNNPYNNAVTPDWTLAFQGISWTNQAQP